MKNRLSVWTNNDLLLKKVTYDETLSSSVIKEEPPDTEKFDSLSSSDKHPLTEAKIDDFKDISSVHWNCWSDIPCMKSVRIRSFYGPYFPAFGLNVERYIVGN